MNPSNHTEALARVYAAAIGWPIDTREGQRCVRDFVTLINTLEDEERERVGSKPA